MPVSQKNYCNTYFLNNVGSQAKSQQLLSTNENTPKMSVRVFLRRVLPLLYWGDIVHHALMIKINVPNQTFKKLSNDNPLETRLCLR